MNLARKIKHFPNISIVSADMKVFINMGRVNANLDRAQWWLDNQVMNDMVPYMPHNTGTFVNVTRAQSAAIAGTGKVVAGAAPMGRFLYEGVVMVDPETNSPWARPGAKKIVTARPLTYSNPKATPHWFDTAKEKHGKQWIAETKAIAGGK